MIKQLRKWKIVVSTWMLQFAQKPYAKTIIFFHSLADSSFFPITIDLTLIPISIAAPPKSFIFAFWATFGSVLGALLSYYIGHELMASIGESIVTLFKGEGTWEYLLNNFRGDLAIWTLIVAALTPLPFALATMACGVVEMELGTFILISVLGRMTRFLLLGLLIYYFGPAVQVFIDKYSKLLAMIFLILLSVFVIYLVIFGIS
jgi:membrane protein YqaA with SNARE-associated domain